MNYEEMTTPQLVRELQALQDRLDEVDKERQAAAREAEFLRVVLDSFQGVATAWDAKGIFLYANRMFFELSGFSREVIGKPFTDVYPPQELAKLSKVYKDLENQPDGTCASTTTHGLNSAGEWVALQGDVIKQTAPPMNGYVGFSREVNDDAATKESYKESVEAMAVVLNSVQDALLIHDRNGTVIQFNEKAVEIFEIDRVEAVLHPKTIDHLCGPEDDSIDLKSLWDGVLNGSHNLVDYRMTRRTDGKVFDVEIFMRPIRLKGEDHILVAIRDITEKKRVTDELHRALALAEKMRIRAEGASDAKSKFLANMSHELRTPLNAILGFSELLEGQYYGSINEKQATYVQAIYSSGEHLLELINDILDLSKVEAGKMTFCGSSVTLGQLLENAFTIIKETAYKRGIRLELEVDEPLLSHEIWADEIRLKQVVMNLLSNAVKFTPSGGTVRLEATKTDHEIQISVRDNGIGIEPEDQSRIFEEFEQVDSSFSRHQQGTGLGLSLTRKLVEMHGGNISVQSDGQNRGSVFKFQIPYVLPPMTETTDHRSPETLSTNKAESVVDDEIDHQNRPTIMVVEDNSVNMKLTTNLLEIGGYRALPAFSSEEAINILKNQTPDLILMDISLPGMDGLTATQAIKKNPSTANIPVVALTAHAMKDDKERAVEAGCDAYLLKPIETRTFYMTISGLLNSKR